MLMKYIVVLVFSNIALLNAEKVNIQLKKNETTIDLQNENIIQLDDKVIQTRNITLTRNSTKNEKIKLLRSKKKEFKLEESDALNHDKYIYNRKLNSKISIEPNFDKLPIESNANQDNNMLALKTNLRPSNEELSKILSIEQNNMGNNVVSKEMGMNFEIKTKNKETENNEYLLNNQEPNPISIDESIQNSKTQTITPSMLSTIMPTDLSQPIQYMTQSQDLQMQGHYGQAPMQPSMQGSYGQPQQMQGPYEQAPMQGSYGQAQQMHGPYEQVPMQPPMQGPYGQAPMQGSYGQAPMQPPMQGSYGQAPMQGSYGQAPMQGSYGQAPMQGSYGQAPMQPPMQPPMPPMPPIPPMPMGGMPIGGMPMMPFGGMGIGGFGGIGGLGALALEEGIGLGLGLGLGGFGGGIGGGVRNHQISRPHHNNNNNFNHGNNNHKQMNQHRKNF